MDNATAGCQGLRRSQAVEDLVVILGDNFHLMADGL
jgi:hypothetical protein